MLILSTIEEAMDTLENKISWQELAKVAGVSKSALSHFKKDGTELNFPSLLSIAKYIFKNNYLGTIKHWSLKLRNPQNIRFAMEYLAVNKLVDELEEMVTYVLSNYQSRKEVDWAKAYKIQLKYLKNIPTSAVLEEIKNFSPKSPETKVFMTILEINCRSRSREFGTMWALTTNLDKDISKLKEDFIKESYQVRLKEIFSYVYLLHKNDPITARKFANEIISSQFCATLTAHSYYIVGMSYLFDNYDECLGNIEKYRDALKDLGRLRHVEQAENCDIPFIKNVWKTGERPETSDIAEIAHYEAVSGDKVLAVKLLDKVISEQGESGFSLYYKAIANDDLATHMESLIYFVSKKGDRFYANLPYRYLKNDPVFGRMANLLMSE